ELAGPLHLLERDFYGFPLGRDAAVRLARRPEANNDLGRFHFEDDAQPPGVDVRGRAHFGQLRAPVTAHVDMVDGTAPAARAIKLDEAVDQSFARVPLQLGIECGAHRKSATVEFVLAKPGEQRPAHLLGEELGSKYVCSKG